MKRLYVVFLSLISMVILVSCSPLDVLDLAILAQPNPPKPKIKYGEFPFKLVYEKDGEEITVEDTLICEFDGFEANAAAGKYRNWKSRLASGNEKILFHYDENTESVWSSEKALTQEIYYKTEAAWYLMGDFEEDDVEFYDYKPSFPNASASESYERGVTSPGGVLKADLLLSRFGIKLISWEIAPPIENSFR